jgi:cullin-associated NEDD8-dissociated protein 1
LAIKIRKVLYVCQAICGLLQESEETKRDIAALGLKTFLQGLPQRISDITTIIGFLVPTLLLHLKKVCFSNKDEVDLDVVDILSDLMGQYGGTINSNSDADSLQQHLLDTLLLLFDHPRPVVRKRAIQAMGVFATISFDSTFEALSSQVIKLMEQRASEKNDEKLQSCLLAVATLCRASPNRMGKHFRSILESTLSYVHFEDDEVKEQCLQSLESFVESMNVEESQWSAITDVGTECIKYDPNYLDDDDEEMDEDEDGFSEEAFSDTDDVSWKVRRGGAKLLCAVIKNIRGDVSSLYTALGPLLVKRFSEREEVVRNEIFETFIAFVNVIAQEDLIPNQPNAKRRKGTHGQHVDHDAAMVLHGDIASICTAIAKQLNTKSVQTTLLGFTLLTRLVQVLRGGLESSFPLVLGSIQSALTVEKSYHQSTNTSIKLQVLEFLKCVLEFHEPESLWPFVPTLTRSVLDALRDPFYKIREGAFGVADSLVCVMYPPNRSFPDVSIVKELAESVWESVGSESTDTATQTLATMISKAGSILGASFVDQTVRWYLTQLEGEVSRLGVLKALSVVIESHMAVDLYPAILDQVRVLLKKSHHGGVMETLGCLTLLVPKVEVQSVAKEMVEDLSRVLVHLPDGHVLPLALECLTVVLANAGSLELARMSVQMVLDTMTTHCYQLGGDKGTQAVVGFWVQVVKMDPAFREPLLQHLDQVSSNARHLFAQSVGHVVSEVDLSTVTVPRLLALGYLGERIPVQLPISILNQVFESGEEEQKHAAAFCLGRCAIQQPALRPMLLERATEAPIVLAIQELVTHTTLSDAEMDQFWDVLVQQKSADTLARLVLTQVSKYIPKLQGVVGVRVLRYVCVHSDDPLVDASVRQFLGYVRDEDYEARKAALGLLLAYNKPVDILDDILNETVFREHLVEVQQMGPFVHRIDKGLENRKMAMECIGMLMRHGIRDSRILDTLVKGLGDPSPEMKITTMSILQEFMAQGTNVDAVVEPLRLILQTKPKETAVKQELEMSKRVLDSCISLVLLYKTKNGVWSELVKEVERI